MFDLIGNIFSRLPFLKTVWVCVKIDSSCQSTIKMLCPTDKSPALVFHKLEQLLLGHRLSTFGTEMRPLTVLHNFIVINLEFKISKLFSSTQAIQPTFFTFTFFTYFYFLTAVTYSSFQYLRFF